MHDDIFTFPTELTKICCKCHDRKPLEEFRKNDSGTRRSKCTYCVGVERNTLRYKLKNRETIPPVLTKKCFKCGNVRCSSEFYVERANLDGLNGICKTCDIEKSKRLRDKELETDPVAYKLKEMFWRASQRARTEKLSINITSDYLLKMFGETTHCPYLLWRLDWLHRAENGVNCPRSPSLDKIVPSLGYVIGNVEVISYLANTMKQNATPEQLTTFCEAYLRRSRTLKAA